MSLQHRTHTMQNTEGIICIKSFLKNNLQYRKYSNLVRTQVEIISDTDYLVLILFER